MAWTHRTNNFNGVLDPPTHKTNTMEILWVGESDASELTDYVLVDVSELTKVDGSTPTGVMIENYELSVYGSGTTEMKYAFIEIGSKFIDMCGADGHIKSHQSANPNDQAYTRRFLGDLTVTTIATDADDIVRFRATVTLY